MLLKKALQNLFRKPVATLDNNVAPSVITIDVNLSKKIDTILEQLIEKTHTKKLNIYQMILHNFSKITILKKSQQIIKRESQKSHNLRRKMPLSYLRGIFERCLAEV